jgi:vitamin B12 transporter
MRSVYGTTGAIVLALTPATSHAQAPTTVHEEVIVTASRLPTHAPSRRVLVLERDAIAGLPVHTLSELVQYLAGTGLARRGALDVQADAQLRGATFEQVAVLVNGIRVNDPQSGHFNLDIPFPVETIERIEVLLGPGSAVHGPGAFGGAIAITTGPPAAWRARLRAGGCGLAGATVTGPLAAGFFAAAERRSSAGFAPDTDFADARGVLGWRGEVAGWRLAGDLGADEKRFGAWAFYSTTYPNQWEETRTGLLTADANRRLGSGELHVRGGARQHDDHFLLDRDRPSWYSNRHRTRSGQLQVTLDGLTDNVSWVVGGEGERQSLTSNRLGKHERDRLAGFAELGWTGVGWRLAAQARADHVSQHGWQLSPGLGVEIDLGRGCTLAAHRGHSFRLPSFTDLYYVSPATVGNPDLQAEHAWSDEVTARAPVAGAQLEVGVFRRLAYDLIDYVRGEGGVYHAANHARVRTTGVELGLVSGTIGPVQRVRLSGAWLDSHLDVDPGRSRYALAHPRFEAGLTGSVALPLAVTALAGLRVRKPLSTGGYAVADLRLERAVTHGFVVELEATNLLNRSYTEVEGVPMPGRWVSFALNWRSDAP